LAVYAPINDEMVGIFSRETPILTEENTKVNASNIESVKNDDKNGHRNELSS
jgi:hypothetical protein